MLSYTELLKPSVVTHFAVLPEVFSLDSGGGETRSEDLLVVVRGDSLLQCFRGLSRDGQPGKLTWVSEFTLQGTVQQMVHVDNGMLAVSFSSAKLVLLAWNHRLLRFEPQSLHYYEQHSTGRPTVHKLMASPRHGLLGLWVQPELLSVLRFGDSALNLSTLINGSSYPLSDSEKPPASPHSDVSFLTKLKGELGVSEIVDMALLPYLIEPTWAVLAWSTPSWAGLVSAQGAETKVLMSVSAGVQGRREPVPPALLLARLPYDVSRILPIQGVENRLILLLASRSMYFLDAANEVSEVSDATSQSDRGYDLANCAVTQLGSTPYVFVVLRTGNALLVDISAGAIVQSLPNWLQGGSPTTLTSHNEFILCGSRNGNAQIAVWHKESVADSDQNTSDAMTEEMRSLDLQSLELQSLGDLYTADRPAVQPKEGHIDIRVVHELVNYGSFSAIATITDGLACATNNGVLVVERELGLFENDNVTLDRDVEPGSFWLPSSGNRPLLISSYVEIDAPPSSKQQQESGESTPKRLKADDSMEKSPKDSKNKSKAVAEGQVAASKSNESAPKEKAVTEIAELFRARKSRSSPQLPRGVSQEQTTLAVYEFGKTMWIVQSKSIAVFEARTWRPLRSQCIEACDFADISSTRIMTYTSPTGRCNVYCPEKLTLLFQLDKQDTATISSTLLLSSQGSLVRVQTLTENKESEFIAEYDASNLDTYLEPLTGSAELKTRAQEQPPYLSLYALRFNELDYIGIHLDRIFVIYELFNGALLKRFTLPFAVNQSPIYLPNIEALIFPGKKTHILVKGQACPFQYHRLALYGDHLIDAVPLPNNEFAWLDDKETLHFSRLDSSLEIHSHALPVRFVPLEVEKASIKTIAFHEDSASVVIGVNIEQDLVETQHLSSESQEVENGEENNDQDVEDTYGETVDEVVDEMAAGETEKKESPAPTYHGQVYLLSLETYRFQSQPLTKFKEALVSMCMVDYDEPNCHEMLAVGTAGLTVEAAETNGHLYLYKFTEVEPVEKGKETAGDLQNSEDPTDEEKPRDKRRSENLHSEESEERMDDLPLVSLKQIAEEHLRGAVSSIVNIMKYLAVAHGNQIHIYNIHGLKQLDPIAFLNTDIYVQDLKAARNILGLGERLRAARLVNFATTPHRTDPLASADPDTTQQTSAVEFVSSAARGDLSLVCAGLDRRIQIFQYDPENLDSNGGSRLVPVADFYSGRQCNAMCAAQIYNNNDLVTYGVTSDGTLFTIRPLTQEMYQTFHILVHQLMEREAGEAGLNPKMFRATPVGGPSSRNKMLDLDFARRFWSLSVEHQAAYGRILGFQGLSRAQRALSVEGRDLLKL